MEHYRLSESRVSRVIHTPKRIEEGIAPRTIAMMQPTSLRKMGKNEDWSQEIWVMIQEMKSERKVISAWRYPGRTKPREGVAIEFLQREYDEYIDDEA